MLKSGILGGQGNHKSQVLANRHKQVALTFNNIGQKLKPTCMPRKLVELPPIGVINGSRETEEYL